jgi:hypothetical protein
MRVADRVHREIRLQNSPALSPPASSRVGSRLSEHNVGRRQARGAAPPFSFPDTRAREVVSTPQFCSPFAKPLPPPPAPALTPAQMQELLKFFGVKRDLYVSEVEAIFRDFKEER